MYEDIDEKGYTYHPPTLCWECARVYANRDCPWAMNFEPVPGWVATKTKLRDCNGEHAIISYDIRKCPLFVRDSRWGVKAMERLSEKYSPERSDVDGTEREADAP